MRATYSISQHSRINHSFIRREILALEHLDMTVQRIALRVKKLSALFLEGDR
ncbi:MAG: hypothetical protein WBL28_11175 [Methylotenera sp.]